ncbi:MAG: hypothetical protein AAF738_03735, partial [Bacteroidota bacterium]
MRAYFFLVICWFYYDVSYCQWSFQKVIETEGINLRHLDMVCEQNVCYVLSTAQKEVLGDILRGIIITKINELGKIEWSKEYVAECYLPTVYQTLLTKDGNLVVTFSTVEYYSSCTPLIDMETFGAYMLNIDSDGELIWDIRPNTVGISSIETIEAPNGNLVLIDEGTVHHMNIDGELIWKKDIITSGDFQLLKVLSTTDNHLFLAGTRRRGPEFPDNIYNGVLIKMDESGEVIWSKVFQDFRPWELNLFPNGDILFTAHQLRTIKEARYMRLSPDGQVHWVKHLPLKNKFLREHILTLEDGSILDFINTGTDTRLLKLNSQGQVLWGRIYSANDNITEWSSQRGRLLNQSS